MTAAGGQTTAGRAKDPYREASDRLLRDLKAEEKA